MHIKDDILVDQIKLVLDKICIQCFKNDKRTACYNDFCDIAIQKYKLSEIESLLTNKNLQSLTEYLEKITLRINSGEILDMPKSYDFGKGKKTKK